MISSSASVDYQTYLRGRSKMDRLRALAEMAQAGRYMPISLTDDLLCLELGADEKLALLARTHSRDNLALEHFLTTHIASESQELAALALRLWSSNSEHLLWHRILSVLQSPHVSQRVFYTIVDLAFFTGGERIIRAAIHADGLEEMSTALHGLLLHRACQWHVEDPRLTTLAQSCLDGLGTHLHPENKALVSALTYLKCFHAEDFQTLLSKPALAEPWRDMIRAMNTKVPESVWPPVWQRAKTTQEKLAKEFNLLYAEGAATGASARTAVDSHVSNAWETFGGTPLVKLEAALGLLESDHVFTTALDQLSGLLPAPATSRLLAMVKERLAKTQDPAALLGAIPLRLRLELTSDNTSKPTSAFAQVKREQTAVLAGSKVTLAQFTDYSHDRDLSAKGPHSKGPTVACEEPQQMASRQRFFALAYRHQQGHGPVTGDAFFQLLSDAWTDPSENKINGLAELARQIEGVLRLCYINTLGRFKGHDQAVLKLMEFVRSGEKDDLRAVLHALGDIGTPRAALELVASLTRPNITPALQLEACAALQKLDLANLQKELHAAVNDLGVETDRTSIRWEVRETLVGLLQSDAAGESPKSAPKVSGFDVSDQRLDQELGAKIPNYRELSSEVKRALRTSQFFHMQVGMESAPATIDLSPVIDMQYKSLELLFREFFEEPCSRLIHRGMLQRRLDVIGYARPIPRAMDEFEHFIASLPTVREIPFFSNFKLRKMLRAICQFRPGRRFTLDGLKAFALFFLCFSRSECPHGLAGLFPLGMRDDRALFDFCKSLHMLQDFRNRAAHEGFHPDAANDIDGIWRSTAEIVQIAFQIRPTVEESVRNDFAPRNRSNPIIEKKVS